jgi:hypothetical protein
MVLDLEQGQFGWYKILQVWEDGMSVFGYIQYWVSVSQLLKSMVTDMKEIYFLVRICNWSIINRMYENQNLLYIVPVMRHTIVVCMYLGLRMLGRQKYTQQNH